MSLTLPAGEISVLLGPSGTGKSVFLKTLVGLLQPDRGSIWIDGQDLPRLPRARPLRGAQAVRRAVPGRRAVRLDEHLRQRRLPAARAHPQVGVARSGAIVTEKLEMVGLIGRRDEAARRDLRRHAQAGRAGPGAGARPARSSCSTSPTPGLDPVRTAYLNQLIIDLNQQTDATFLIVTHDINTARTVPDNIGLLYHGHLAMFGPREMLLSSTEPVVRQFLNAQRIGPIGMAEEKDADELQAEPSRARSCRRCRRSRRQLRPPTAAAPGRAAPGQWCRDNGVTPPPGSFADPARRAGRPARCGVMSGAGTGALRQTRQLLRVLPRRAARRCPRRPFQVREFVQQAWFIAQCHDPADRAGLDPVRRGHRAAARLPDPPARRAVASPARPSVLAVVREAGPIVTALIIAGAGGSAICADLGSRKIREEIDAMEVLGIDPIQRLVVPRVLASMLVAVLLNGLVIVVGVAGGYFFNVVMQGGTPGAYLASRSQALAQLPDLFVGEVKALVFGAIAAMVASYKGMNARGGPKGVGDAVNQSRGHHLHAAVRRQLRHHRRLLPGRPAEARMTAMTCIGRGAAPRTPSTRSTTSAASCRSTCARSAWTPRTLRRYSSEVVRLLAEVSFGTGALAVIGGTVGVISLPDLLHRHRGRAAGLPGARPDRQQRVHRLHLGLLQHPRDRAAGRRRSRCRPPSAAASPPSSARCGSPRRSTRSR